MAYLTRDEAAARAELLRVHRYQVDLDVSDARDAARFTSTTTVRFSCTDPGADTFVELTADSVEEVRLNGVPLDAGVRVGNRLPLAGLRAENELLVRATMGYSSTGEGVHRFVDPADGEVYLYAMAGPDNAQRIFACFDQPDLKALVSLTLTAPPQWTVWGNGAGSQTAPGRWEFAQTPPLSTYLVTFVAGAYHSVHDEHDGIRLGLICRRSLAPVLDREADEIFDLTKACLDRFHELFQIRYPFGKYDQAFVAEFNWGAVENPGLVVFRDDEFLFRSAVTRAQREQRAVVIAHEMAHMWFGDLVTLRWWDDIWLNESFAEYMGWRVAVEATPFVDAWTTFAVRRKGSGYVADQRPSTHPVAPTDVQDTVQALANFDGISYAKGASVLRQLVAWLGDETFLSGLRAYFAAHAFANATLADLLAALSRASGRDLDGWAEVWLRRAQLNTLRPEVGLGPDGRYAEVAVVQSAPERYATLRPHRIGVGIYDGDPAVCRERVEVDLDGGRTTVDDLVGVEPGRLLLVNDGDLTFAKVRFDEASRAGLAGVLPHLGDSLARAVVWTAAADATRDGELAAEDYLGLAVAGLPVESEVAIFDAVLDVARSSIVDQYVASDARPAVLSALADACQRALDRAPAGSGLRLAAARGLIRCATRLPLLRGWLEGHDVPDGLTVDAELRWALLYRLVVLAGAGEAEIASEVARDPSAQGAEHAARCRAAVPDQAAKARAWHIVVDDDTVSARFMTVAAEGFFHPEQAELTEPYVARYFAEMPAMAARRTPYAMREVARAAYPRFAVSRETAASAEATLARDDLDPALRRVILDATDDLRRALRVREVRCPL